MKKRNYIEQINYVVVMYQKVLHNDEQKTLFMQL